MQQAHLGKHEESPPYHDRGDRGSWYGSTQPASNPHDVFMDKLQRFCRAVLQNPDGPQDLFQLRDELYRLYRNLNQLLQPELGGKGYSGRHGDRDYGDQPYREVARHRYSPYPASQRRGDPNGWHLDAHGRGEMVDFIDTLDPRLVDGLPGGRLFKGEDTGFVSSRGGSEYGPLGEIQRYRSEREYGWGGRGAGRGGTATRHKACPHNHPSPQTCPDCWTSNSLQAPHSYGSDLRYPGREHRDYDRGQGDDMLPPGQIVMRNPRSGYGRNEFLSTSNSRIDDLSRISPTSVTLPRQSPNFNGTRRTPASAQFTRDSGLPSDRSSDRSGNMPATPGQQMLARGGGMGGSKMPNVATSRSSSSLSLGMSIGNGNAQDRFMQRDELGLGGVQAGDQKEGMGGGNAPGSPGSAEDVDVVPPPKAVAGKGKQVKLEVEAEPGWHPAGLDDAWKDKTYVLEVVQNPIYGCRGGIGAEGAKGNRRPISPYPIVQLHIKNADGSHVDLNTVNDPMFIMATYLVGAESASRCDFVAGRPVMNITGCTASSMYRVKGLQVNPDGTEQTCLFFVFSDINIRDSGLYRLKFVLYYLNLYTQTTCPLATTCTEQFEVFSYRRFQAKGGLGVSTPLSVKLSYQGIRLQLRSNHEDKRPKAGLSVKEREGLPYWIPDKFDADWLRCYVRSKEQEAAANAIQQQNNNW